MNQPEEELIDDPAFDYIISLGVDPTPEALAQLSGPFAKALIIICTRGYGDLWKVRGWKGLVHDIINKTERIRHLSWINNEYHEDSAIDLINFAGMYVRMGNDGPKWGKVGDPG
jgi:hypothetical protein